MLWQQRFAVHIIQAAAALLLIGPGITPAAGYSSGAANCNRPSHGSSASSSGDISAPASGAAPRAAPAIPAAPRRGDPRYDPNRDPEYLGRLLQGYNNNVWRTNRQLQAAGERQEIALRQLRARATAANDVAQAEIRALEGRLEIE